MEDEIDYGALFGVTPEDGQDQDSSQGQEDNPDQDGDQSQDGGQGEGTGQDQDAGQDQDDGQRQDNGQGQGGNQGQEGARGENPAAPVASAGPSPDDAAKRALDEAFALSGLKNPYTGQPITSKAEYDAYKTQFERERREEGLKRTGMTEEEFSRFLQETPEFREARQAREAAEKAIREAREAAAQAKVAEQLKEISTMDPSVKTLSDLAKMPNYPRFYELVQRGNTLTDAFRLANFDALAQRAAAGARQAAANAARSKEHLEQTRTRGRGAVVVPAEVREQYKLFNPDATEEEIQRHYQKYHKKEA